MTLFTKLAIRLTVDDGVRKNFIDAYEQYSDAIFRHCFFRLCCDRDLALDMMQETFTKTWDYIAKENEIESIRPFLYKTATNLIIDYSRRKKTISLDEMQENMPEIRPSKAGGENLHNNIDVKIAYACINKLNPQYKDVLLMRYLGDLPVNEIAEVLGETENNVSVRIHRGIKQLQKMLKA